MDDDAKPPVILPVAEAKRRYLIYIAMKLAGIAALFAGVFLARGGFMPAAAALLALGSATLFVRPRMLGLSKRPEA